LLLPLSALLAFTSLAAALAAADLDVEGFFAGAGASSVLSEDTVSPSSAFFADLAGFFLLRAGFFFSALSSVLWPSSDAFTLVFLRARGLRFFAFC